MVVERTAIVSYKSIIGPNAALRYLKAYQAHVDYWKEVNPVTALAYVDKPEHAVYIEQYAETFPDALIVARIKHDLDGGFHLKPAPPDDRYYVSSPGDYHRAYGYLGRKKNIVLNVMNEPNGFASEDEIVRLERWMIEYIALAAREKTKSVLFNWADRNPQIIAGMFDPRFDDVLKLMAQYPDIFYMGMHFYGPDEIVSHIESYVTRCERLGIVPLKVIGTEFGLDKHDGSAANGYKAWGWGGLKYATWQCDQVKYALQPYIKRGVLIGLHVFQEGNSGGWEAFDIENDQAYKAEIKRASQAGELEPMVLPTTPTYQPVNFTPGSKYTLQSEGGARSVLRAAPVVAGGNNVGNNLDDKTEVLLYEVSRVGIDYWYKVEVVADKRQGWLSGRGGSLTFTPVPVVQPPPVVVDPPPVVVQPPPYPDIDATYAREMAMVYSDLADSYEAMITATRKTSAQWAKLADIVQGKHPELTDVNPPDIADAA